VCGKTDVPLIMGGHYCQSCAGPGVPAFAEPPSNGKTFIHKFWAAPKPDLVIQPHVIDAPPSQPTDANQAALKRKKVDGTILQRSYNRQFSDPTGRRGPIGLDSSKAKKVKVALMLS